MRLRRVVDQGTSFADDVSGGELFALLILELTFGELTLVKDRLGDLTHRKDTRIHVVLVRGAGVVLPRRRPDPSMTAPLPSFDLHRTEPEVLGFATVDEVSSIEVDHVPEEPLLIFGLVEITPSIEVRETENHAVEHESIRVKTVGDEPVQLLLTSTLGLDLILNLQGFELTSLDTRHTVTELRIAEIVVEITIHARVRVELRVVVDLVVGRLIPIIVEPIVIVVEDVDIALVVHHGRGFILIRAGLVDLVDVQPVLVDQLRELTQVTVETHPGLCFRRQLMVVVEEQELGREQIFPDVAVIVEREFLFGILVPLLCHRLGILSIVLIILTQNRKRLSVILERPLDLVDRRTDIRVSLREHVAVRNRAGLQEHIPATLDQIGRQVSLPMPEATGPLFDSLPIHRNLLNVRRKSALVPGPLLALAGVVLPARVRIVATLPLHTTIGTQFRIEVRVILRLAIERGSERNLGGPEFVEIALDDLVHEIPRRLGSPPTRQILLLLAHPLTVSAPLERTQLILKFLVAIRTETAIERVHLVLTRHLLPRFLCNQILAHLGERPSNRVHDRPFSKK